MHNDSSLMRQGSIEERIMELGRQRQAGSSKQATGRCKQVQQHTACMTSTQASPNTLSDNCFLNQSQFSRAEFAALQHNVQGRPLSACAPRPNVL